MVIKIGNIELTNWYSNWTAEDLSGCSPDIIWYKCRKYTDSDYKDSSPLVAVRVDVTDKTKCYVNFYYSLKFLTNLFGHECGIEGDLEFAKNEVDNFICRINNMKAFW